MLDSLLQDDADRVFLDWGRTAKILEVQRNYDVGTGRLEERSYSSDVLVVTMEDAPRSIRDVTATASLTQKLLLIREREIPPQISLTSARVVLDETTYEVRAMRESNFSGVVVLECVTKGAQAAQ